MNVRCPLCGSECCVEGILVVGQHVRDDDGGFQGEQSSTILTVGVL